MSKSDGSGPTIQVLARAYALLDVLAAHTDPVPLKELSARTGLHPSTAHRILNDLAEGRFVERPEAGSYRLGMRLLELGNLVKARLDVREAAIGPMRELHKITHQPVNLSVRQGDEIVYIERTYSERSGMQVVRAVGGRAPLHLTSVGKLFLANDEPQRVRAYATRTGLTGHTRNSLTDLPMLERELDKIRKLSISRDDEELELGVRCMAAGIYDDQGRLVAGLSISAPADRLEESWLDRVKETAARISAALGHSSARPWNARGHHARVQRPRADSLTIGVEALPPAIDVTSKCGLHRGAGDERQTLWVTPTTIRDLNAEDDVVRIAWMRGMPAGAAARRCAQHPVGASRVRQDGQMLGLSGIAVQSGILGLERPGFLASVKVRPRNSCGPRPAPS